MDWEKEIRYNDLPVYITYNLSHISTAKLTSDEVSEIQNASIKKVQALLSKFY